MLQIVLIVPAPFLDQTLDDEVDAPPGLFMDFINNGKNFFLLGPGDEAFTGMVNGTKCYTCHTPDGI